MKNPLPSEDFIMSLDKGDKIILLGQEMEVNFYETNCPFQHKRWYLQRVALGDEVGGYEGDGGIRWFHARSSQPDSHGKAAMPKEELAAMIASGNFYIG